MIVLKCFLLILRWKRIPANMIVKGDIIALVSGQKVPARCRLLLNKQDVLFCTVSEANEIYNHEPMQLHLLADEVALIHDVFFPSDEFDGNSFFDVGDVSICWNILFYFHTLILILFLFFVLFLFFKIYERPVLPSSPTLTQRREIRRQERKRHKQSKRKISEEADKVNIDSDFGN